MIFEVLGFCCGSVIIAGTACLIAMMITDTVRKIRR